MKTIKSMTSPNYYLSQRPILAYVARSYNYFIVCRDFHVKIF